ncbi:hypothetical protein bcgnr5390_63090 [Bacillus luti]|uniref:hypothetical protein n=1 Tax=Bacillaceae TaxID=186817 RepID=UPI00217D252E|nr:hypothetical protein [Heyndrickxia oleronia]HDR8077014.1 hypothetical protein [Bacillus cereus]HEF5066728.1 hypothetical protein [Bacillus cereus]HEF5238603.1 hypothetical protein [Bacillus cereus]
MKVKKVMFQNPSLDFESKLEMYAIQDQNEGSFIFSIPSESFSIKIEREQDIEHFIKFGSLFGHSDFRLKVVNVMRSIMDDFN